ncbi:MAG TPA: helix-turn-helix domain-containing protein, partial [Frankiaceae bacterium]|nr:helix-turn-helix domain-containing protein [Frankiaceae bacterium]
MQSGEGPQTSSIGATLAAAREARGLSVDDVSAITRIRASLICRIEVDDFAGCGGAVYARGHIRGIAKTLQVDPAPLVAEFDRLHAPPAEPIATGPFEPDPVAAREMRARRGPRWAPAMVVALTVVCVVALVLLLIPGGRTGGRQAGPTAPPATSSPPPTPVARPTTPPPLAFAGVNVRVRIKNDPSWVSVTDDMRRQLVQQVLPPGEVRDFKAARRLVVVLGNSGAVELACNGKALGSPGLPEQVQTF